jgi:hypothetical protein
MSSFMMDPGTTAMLAKEIVTLVEHGYVSPRLPQKTFINSKDKEVVIKACHKWNQQLKVPYIHPVDDKILFQVMENMNARALNDRYGDDISECINPYPASVLKPANMVSLYKSLQCYLYQCCEGKVPETALYKALQNIANTLARYIVSDLPEYEAANWG